MDAERAYRDVLKDDPNNPDLYDGLGSALLMQGRVPKDAVESVRPRRQDHRRRRPSYRINRGLALMELARVPEAEEDFQVADTSSIPDDRLAAAINRGRLRQMQGDYVGAEEQFTTALSQRSEFFAATSDGASRGRRAATCRRGGRLPRGRAPAAPQRRREPAPGSDAPRAEEGSLGCRYLERAVEIDPGGDVGSQGPHGPRARRRRPATSRRPQGRLSRPPAARGETSRFAGPNSRYFPLPMTDDPKTVTDPEARPRRRGPPSSRRSGGALHDPHRDPREARDGGQEGPRDRRDRSSSRSRRRCSRPTSAPRPPRRCRRRPPARRLRERKDLKGCGSS